MSDECLVMSQLSSSLVVRIDKAFLINKILTSISGERSMFIGMTLVYLRPLLK